MADVWLTVSRAERHFAEGLGLWEVNVYKAILYFQAHKWKKSGRTLSHSEFRSRLAHALMTLGQSRYPADVVDNGNSETSTSAGAGSRGSSSSSPLDDCCHEYVTHPGKTCSYCGWQAKKKCASCERSGRGLFIVCNHATGRGCMARHAAGEDPVYRSWSMSQAGKEKLAERMKEQRQERAQTVRGKNKKRRAT